MYKMDINESATKMRDMTSTKLKIDEILKIDDFMKDWKNPYQTDYTISTLKPESLEYCRVRGLFDDGTFSYKVDKIHRVENPQLLVQYYLKKKEIEKKNGEICKEELMFHGSTSENIQEICRHNFDITKVKRNMCGHGISLAKNSFFASFYGLGDLVKKMICVRILIGKVEIADINNRKIAPSPGFDGTMRSDGAVHVKYQANYLYPAYIIEYSPINISPISESSSAMKILTESVKTDVSEDNSDPKKKYVKSMENCIQTIKTSTKTLKAVSDQNNNKIKIKSTNPCSGEEANSDGPSLNKRMKHTENGQ